MGSPSATPAGSTPATPYSSETSIPVAQGAPIVTATALNINNNVTMGQGSTPGIITLGTTVGTGVIAPLSPKKPKDSYIKAGEGSQAVLVVSIDGTNSLKLTTLAVDISGLNVGEVRLRSAAYGSMSLFDSPQGKAFSTSDTASFLVTRDTESCEIAVYVDTLGEQTQSSITETCSFLDGAQALTLAEQMAAQIK